MSKSKVLTIFAVIIFLMVAVITIGVTATKDRGKSSSQISKETAVEKLEKYLKGIDLTTETPRKATVEIGKTNLQDELPDISQYPLGVVGKGELNLEIFSSPEKAGSGTDAWLLEVAEDFNDENYTIDGKQVSVSVRSMASGLAVDYITSGKYVPDAYTPSNTFWGDMIAAGNVEVEVVADRLVGNTAGLVLSEETADMLTSQYGGVSMESIIEATVDNQIAMGYTNPYTSSSGLNFLISCLSEFDSNDPLSNNAISKFAAFQSNIPFVAYTTLQMRDAAETGVLDAMILEYQGYYNETSLRDYTFVPYGIRHDNPMYAIGALSSERMDALNLFTDYCLSDDAQELAEKYGFNRQEEYVSDVPSFDGNTLISAQKLWKKEKDAGKPVVAVFVADVSGSMAGEPINNLRTSLINASQYINDTNYIGLVSYSTDVSIQLPIQQFDLNQRAYFTGAVEDLTTNGSTATYDAVLVALDMLMDAKETIPDAKPMLFVLSDGETNEGTTLNQIRGIVDALEVPVYTIGYNTNLEALEELSSINEAASINAKSDDVVYQLKNLFNAQM